MIPEGLKFLDSHEWARCDGDIVTVGLSDYAIEQLGDIVFLELPGTGDKVTKGASFGIIESIKTASDMYSPVTGQVIEVNERLNTDPELFNTDPYGQCWIMKIKAEDPKEIESLMDAKSYEEYLKGF